MIPKGTKLKRCFQIFKGYFQFEKLWLQIISDINEIDSQEFDTSLSYKENVKHIQKKRRVKNYE